MALKALTDGLAVSLPVASGFCCSSSLLKTWLRDLLWSIECRRDSVPVSNLKEAYGLLFFLGTLPVSYEQG